MKTDPSTTNVDKTTCSSITVDDSVEAGKKEKGVTDLGQSY